jgi:hypothetical protein
VANVYYGDGGVSTVTGNWNTVSNWFSTLFTTTCCCSCYPVQVPGTPLGRLPTAGDTVWITSNPIAGGSVIAITTAPIIPYTGDLNSHSGTWSINTPGVTWSNNINLSNGFLLSGAATFPTWAGIFTGTWTLPQLFSIDYGYFLNGASAVWKGVFAIVAGGFRNDQAPGWVPVSGTYAPNIAATINTTTGVITCTHPANPGFGAPGRASVYAPVITVSPLPSGGGVNGVTFPVTFK